MGEIYCAYNHYTIKKIIALLYRKNNYMINKSMMHVYNVKYVTIVDIASVEAIQEQSCMNFWLCY